MDSKEKIKVINKYNGSVGYEIPELGVNRIFYPKESKLLTFEELEKLSFIPGGLEILRNYLQITDENAVIELFNEKSEPEYHYSEEDIKNIMISGTLDQFLDCLDFSPNAIKEIIKQLAVDLPLNDMAKREAIQDKLNFNVTKAIEIKNTKFDGGEVEEKTSEVARRRAAPVKTGAAPTGRRYKPDLNK